MNVRDRDVFTTGQVAQVCHVSTRTVCGWFDCGRLKGYRIPGGQDRRIPRDELLTFMRAHHIPLGRLAEVAPDGGPAAPDKLLLIGADDALAESLEALLEGGGFLMERARTAFAAGVLAAGFDPGLVLIDLAMGRDLALAIASELAGGPGRRLVALTGPGETDFPGLRQQGFADWCPRGQLGRLAERLKGGEVRHAG